MLLKLILIFCLLMSVSLATVNINKNGTPIKDFHISTDATSTGKSTGNGGNSESGSGTSGSSGGSSSAGNSSGGSSGCNTSGASPTGTGSGRTTIVNDGVTYKAENGVKDFTSGCTDDGQDSSSTGTGSGRTTIVNDGVTYKSSDLHRTSSTTSSSSTTYYY